MFCYFVLTNCAWNQRYQGKKNFAGIDDTWAWGSATTVRHLKLILTLVDVDLCLFDVAEPLVSIDGPCFNATHYVHRLLVGLVDIYCVGVELIGSDYRVVEPIDMFVCLHISFFDWFVWSFEVKKLEKKNWIRPINRRKVIEFIPIPNSSIRYLSLYYSLSLYSNIDHRWSSNFETFTNLFNDQSLQHREFVTPLPMWNMYSRWPFSHKSSLGGCFCPSVFPKSTTSDLYIHTILLHIPTNHPWVLILLRI